MFGDFPVTKETKDELMDKLFDLQMYIFEHNMLNEASIQGGYYLNPKDDDLELRKVTLQEANDFLLKMKKTPYKDEEEYRSYSSRWRQVKLGFTTFEDRFLSFNITIEKGTVAYHGTSREDALRIRTTGFQRNYQTSYFLTHGLGVYATKERERAAGYAIGGGEVLTLLFKTNVSAVYVNSWYTFQNEILETIKVRVKETHSALSREEQEKINKQTLGLVGRELFERTRFSVFITEFFYYITNPDLISVVVPAIL